MNELTVSEVSRELNISKDTLRYYDKIGLVKALRKVNNYRYYTIEKFLNLKYIQVMKYAGFSLSEIKTIMYNKNNKNEKGLCQTIEIISNKERELLKKIKTFKKIVEMLHFSKVSLENKYSDSSIDMDSIILGIYSEIEVVGK